MRPARYDVIDRTTGEVFDIKLVPRYKAAGGKWVKVFVDGVQALVCDNPHFRGQTWRVLYYIEAHTTWGTNEVPTPTEAASALSLGRTVVSRSYSELALAGAIFKRGTRYYLSPVIGWHGTVKQLEAAYRELYAGDHAPSLLALPSGKP